MSRGDATSTGLDKTEFVLLSGYNPRAVIAACRALTSAAAPFSIIARGADDPIHLTRYHDRVQAEVHATGLDLAELCDALVRVRTKARADRLILLPTAEYVNRFSLRNREAIERAANCLLPLPSEKTYLAISDKERFSELCAEAGIAVPPTFASLPEPGRPFAAKPRAEFTPAGKRCYPYIVRDREDLERFVADENLGDYYFQEYIGGKSYYLLFYFYEDGRYEHRCQRNGAQQPGGKSIVFAWEETFPQPEIVERFVALFRRLAFRGLVMVELKGDSEHYFMIEANPRLWGPIQLVLDSGSNLIACYADEYGAAAPLRPAKTSRGRPYLWLSGLVSGASSSGGLTWFEGGRAAILRKALWLPLHEVWLRPDAARVFAREAAECCRQLATRPATPSIRRDGAV